MRASTQRVCEGSIIRTLMSRHIQDLIMFHERLAMFKERTERKLLLEV